MDCVINDELKLVKFVLTLGKLVPIDIEFMLVVNVFVGLLFIDLDRTEVLSDFQSEFTNEKSRNSPWLIAFTMIGSISVRTGSSFVKSLSKLPVSLASFYYVKKILFIKCLYRFVG